MSPVLPLNQKKLTKLPSAADNFNTLSSVNCMLAMPLTAAYSKPEEHLRSSPNPFMTKLHSTNPFTEQNTAGNPFQIENQGCGIVSYGSTEEPAPHPFPPLKPPGHPKDKATFSVNTFEDGFNVQTTSSLNNNGRPKGWVTFEEDDCVLKLKTADNPTGLKRASSVQTSYFPSSLGIEQNSCGSNSTPNSDWNKSFDSFFSLPTRLPPAPPVPSRSASTKSATDPWTSPATQDFTER